MTTQKQVLSGLAVAVLGLPGMAWAQVPYDPPTAQRAAPNVLLLMDATRTTLINGATCRGECHIEDSGPGGEHVSDLYQYGETRLQLARRVLTGGWGWDTAGQERPPGTRSADARVRRDGVMDQYFVRWGVLYYDGVGPRLALNPTLNNELAQQRVIDFAQPGYGENLPNPGYVTPALNSFLPYFRSTQCCGNHASGLGPDGNSASSPLFGDAGSAAGRMTWALRYTHDYINSTGAFPQWAPNPQSLATFGAPPASPVGNFFRGDPANVLNSAPPAGCRRNFVIHMTDGHGGGDYGGQTRQQAAAAIYNMRRNDSSVLPAHLSNQLFTVHFGVQDYPIASSVMDCGFDGVCGNGPPAFAGAPGGQINDLSPMYAAFSAIFQLVLSGTYLASPPTITRAGDRIVTSSFVIQNCQGAQPNQCNIGRIGNLRLDEVLYPTPASLGVVDDSISFSEILRGTDWNERNLFTSIDATETNCGRAASCNIPGPHSAAWEPVEWNTAPGNGTPTPPATGTDAEFLRGATTARFANGVMRSDTSNGVVAAVAGRNPYKLMDIANSQPVIVGAPLGIGEDIERWESFLDMPLNRSMRTIDGGATGWRQKRGGYPATAPSFTVGTRDQVVYIGGNDGLLHAFLSGRVSGTPGSGRTASYPIAGGDICAAPASPATEFPAQGPRAGCLGLELWAYSPRLVQPFWSSIRSGHYFMVDGTPVVSDVLFTKRTNNPGLVCTPGAGLHSAACETRWEYRTVLLQCLGGGGSGCFAIDVTNPWRPEVLWERQLSTGVSNRGTSTSRPQIARVRRVVGGQVIPYYVGIMGGGLNESTGGATPTRTGSILAVGLEDGDWYSSPAIQLASSDFAGSPTCLDTDGDSYTDTCYAATTDARVYKIRIGSLNPNNQGPSPEITAERFFDGRQRLQTLGEPASVYNAVRAYGRVVATFDRARDIRLFFATGNFEDMQNATEQNFMFELRDTAPEGALVPWSLVLNNSRAGSACTGGPGAGVLPLPLGEKSVFDPVISNGVVVFTSYAPNANPCLPGRGYLNGISVDTCGDGIDSDGNGTTDTGRPPAGPRPGGSGVAGLPVAPVINERTGAITVATDSTAINHSAGFTRRLPAPPVSKLWWRLVR